MDCRYKVIISNKNMYKEIELTNDCECVNVGTDVGCIFRLPKKLFFENIELTFIYTDNVWTVSCSDNLFFTIGDVRKLVAKKLIHGDILEVKYQKSDNKAFIFEFLVDFDYGDHKFERIINLEELNQITIGASSKNEIVLSSPYVKNDEIILEKKNRDLILNIIQTTYGVYHNGKKAIDSEIIKNGDFFSISEFSFFYKGSFLWTESSEKVKINAYKFYDFPNKNNYPKFNRNTRIKNTINEEKIEILDPPAKPKEPKKNIFTRLLPSMGMILASAAMAFMGGRMIVFSAISGVMAIVTTVISVREGKKEFRKNSIERIEKYNNYIELKRNEILRDRESERKIMEEIYISSEKEQERIQKFSADLFDRIPTDEDFLFVRVGTGKINAKRKIEYKKQERLEVEDNLQEIPEQICNQYRELENAPIVCDFKSANGIGIFGEIKNQFAVLKNIIVDLIARQYHTDVKMVFISKEEHKEQILRFRQLPHVCNEDIGIRNIVCDDESKNIIFEYLYKELSIREENKTFSDRIIVFFYDEYGFKYHPISKYIEHAKELGVTFVFFSDEKKNLPLCCDYIVDVQEGRGQLINVEDKNNQLDFEFDIISNKKMDNIIQLLAPVYTEEISLEGSLTKNYSMFEMLDIIAIDDLNLKNRWQTSKVFESMKAPIGISKTGMVELDLHDTAHGPHGLVAGTTGSGKSEILQTYILSMSTLYHPYEVGFVIIDFKGGGMVNQFKELPHLLGAITNIDGKEINRSLKSIKAELQKRQRLFVEAEVNHIDKYIKKFKSGQVHEPLPHLIVIVDEFAELKAEQPEFMKELISAARIGRSLGVHLILATQKPSGQVNEQIWSNSRFKLCLKVQSQEDSNEVIKSPLAAEIKEPGRAYLQVGNNEIFELFQSAYSGDPEMVDDSNMKEFSIYELLESAKKILVFSQKKEKSGQENLSQLDAVIKYVTQYCKSSGIKKLSDICLPSLDKVICFPKGIKATKESQNIIADIGYYDDPDTQYQGEFSVNLTDQNMIIIGSAQTGKTNLLQTIIRSITSKYSPDEVNIYVIDFASMVLKNYEQLKHIGGVVTHSEDEKLKNLFKLIRTEIETRKEKLLSIGVSSFSAYKEAGKIDLPQIILMIDNLTALKEMYFQDDDELLSICREGLSVGITIIIANSQTAGIGYKYLSNFSSRIALFCNDAGEYSSLFDHCKEKIEDIPGRAIVEIDKQHLDCQTYLAFEGEKEIIRVENIKHYISEKNAHFEQSMAKMIPVIPTILTENYVHRCYNSVMKNRFQVVTGLDYDNVSAISMNFSNIGTIALTGREHSGKHNYVKYVIQTMDNLFKNETEVYILSGINRKLDSLKGVDSVIRYSILPEDAVAIVGEIESQLKERYKKITAGSESIIEESKLLLLVIDSQDALIAINNDKEAFVAYKNIQSRYKDMNVCIIISDFENTNIPYGAPDIIKGIRDTKHFIYFDDMVNLKIFDAPLSMTRKYKKPIELGDCYYIKENKCIKMKSVLLGR